MKNQDQVLFDLNYVTDNEYAFDDISEDLQYVQQKLGGGKFLVTSDSGFWNGRQDGYKVVNDLSRGFEFSKIMLTNNGLEFEWEHHDGVNYMTIRKLNDRGVNKLAQGAGEWEDLEELTKPAYSRAITRRELNKII